MNSKNSTAPAARPLRTPARVFAGAPFVYVRTPVLGYESAWDFFAPDWQEQLQSSLRHNDALRLAIHIASPSLSRELSTWLESGRISERAARRLLAYVLRAGTRTTPFGHFAAVSRADAGRATTLEVSSELRTRTRPDMEWLSELVEGLKTDPTFRRMLRVCVNDALVLRGVRNTAYHPSLVHRISRRGSPLTYTPVSFNETEPVAFLKRTLRAPESLIDVAGRLESHFGESREACLELLDQLWEGGFFIDELQLDPSGDPVNAVLDVLSRMDGQRAQEMRRFLEDLQEWDMAPASERSISRYSMLEEQQRLLDAQRTPRLQTDAVREAAGTLSEHVLSDVTLLADVMLRWYPFEMKRYRERFIERYEGTTREVPLLELVHPSLGLGVPDELDLGYVLPPELVEKRLTIASQALLDGSAEVVLSQAELEELLPPRRDDRVAGSFDVGFEILARSAADIEHGDYRVVAAPLVYAPVAGGSIGRFADALGSRTREDLRLLSARTEGVYPDAVVAELVLASSYARGLNVSIRPVQFAHQVRIGLMNDGQDTHVIAPHDLLVGLDESGFYVRSAALNRRVEIVQTHLHNTDGLAPSLGRFLSMLSYEGTIFPHRFDWGVAEKLSFLPRLRCGRTIVSKARWRLAASELLKAYASGAAEFMRRWRIPKCVQLVDRDNVLPLDLSTEIGWDLLHDHAASTRTGTVRLEELMPEPDQAWLQDEHGVRYRGEFIASFVRTDTLTRPVPHIAPVPREERVRAPGSDWTYVKLYTDADDADRFLMREVRALMASLTSSGAAKNWFFVRYADRAEHIRLRIRHESERGDEVARRTEECLSDWVKSGVLATAEIAAYEREIERYGGIEGMTVCERWFGADSRYVLENLLTRGTLQDADRLRFASRTIAAIARVCARALGESAAGLVRYSRGGGLTQGERAAVRALTVDLADGASEAAGVDVASLEELLALHASGRLDTPLAGVIDSLMHMHCNRSGLSPLLEERARIVARQALHGAGRIRTTA